MPIQTLPALIDKMWNDYVEINPLAQKIYDLFIKEGELILNDHIALRTFNHPRVNIDILSRPFLAAGYTYGGDYHFTDKKLYAKHFEHSDTNLPTIFISELKLEEFSPSLNQLVNRLVDEISPEKELAYDFVAIGRPWNLSIQDYNELMKESDYAAWVAAFGYRPNHFTILINALKNFSDITDLNNFLKTNGFKLNASGGEVKGSKEVFLEQSSTLANNIKVDFIDGKLDIPACYFEFAKRYPLPNGKLYKGFVANSADKIFESTKQGQ
jgi:hypothetical protein